MVEVHDLRLDRKRRIVNHDRTVRIRHFLIVAARIKRPYNRAVCQAVLVNRPGLDRLVHRRRRIAIVRGFLRLEFIDKRLIFLGFFACLSCGHSGLKGLRRQRGRIRCTVLRLVRLRLRCSTFRLVLTERLGQRRRVVQDQRLRIKSGECQIHALGLDLAQLQRQHLGVPAGLLRKPVVRQNIRAALCVRQVLDQHARHLGHALGLGRQHAPVSGDDIPVAVDQHRIDKAKLPQARSDLRDLALAVCPRISRIGHQLPDRHAHHLFRHKPRRFYLARPCRTDAFLVCHSKTSKIPAPLGKNHARIGGCGQERPAAKLFKGGGTPRNLEISRQVRAHPPACARPSVPPVSAVSSCL